MLEACRQLVNEALTEVAQLPELFEAGRFDRAMPRGLENKTALNHPGNAVVKTLTLGLDPWETHGIAGNVHNKS